ncbi:hypothetical protein FRB99_005279 [Tulasnella sp. 403]|nr:hypothetical protein FRB99_005279 [Tulasnella sp. 403]
MKVFAIGASRNIGYLSALKFLQQGHTVAFLLRRTNVFDNDDAMKTYIASGKVQLIQGDALVEDDMRRAWTEASPVDTPVDLVLFSVGGTLQFTLKKGFFIHPPNLCTTALLNTLSTYPDRSSEIQPKFVVVTSSGITRSSHNDLPFAMKPVYSVLLKSPHADKLGMEKLLHHSSGSSAAWTEAGPKEAILAPGWESKVGETGWLKHLVIVRPSWLTDGPETGVYKVGEDLRKRYTISRKDVAHFIAGDLMDKWGEFEGKGVVIGY